MAEERLTPEMAQALLLQQRRRQESLVMYQLSSEDILAEIERYLKSMEYDPEQDKLVKMKIAIVDAKGNATQVDMPPIANEVGVNAIMRELKPRVHRIMTLTNFDDEKINDILWEVNQVIIDMLENKHTEFDIDPVYLPNVVNMVDHLLEGQLYRALNEGERRRIYPTQQTIQHLHQTETPQERARFKLFGKKIL